MHTPVLLQKAIESLDIQPGGRYIDATAGEGGHLGEVVGKGGNVLALDWDAGQIERLRSKKEFKDVILVSGNYADIENLATENNFVPVDGVLFDLGLSMYQLSNSGKGFSFKNGEEDLDMRLGDQDDTAADLLNYLSQEELYDMFARYSEDLDSKVIADQVVRTRINRKYLVVQDLVITIEQALKGCTQKHQHDKIKTMTRIFQALRISVNNEFQNITKGLEGALNILKPGGKVVIITFHSLEDRVVKQYIRKNQLYSEDLLKGDKELKYERSALLRVIIKK